MNPPLRSTTAMPAWWAPIDRLVAHAASEIRVLAALTPADAHVERARLTAQVQAGERGVPEWNYARASDAHDDLRRALEAAERMLERAVETPVESLYLERIRELAIEAELCARAGSSDVARLAALRFEPRDAGAVRDASALCTSWLGEPTGPSPDDARRSDDRDPRSLLSRMQAEVGRMRLPFAVVATPWLAPLAATGESVILVATGRLVADEDARRTVLHEVEGHALPRVRSGFASSTLFRAGTARGIDDQEGRALLLEERGGFLGPRRRRQLAARHRAVESMRDGAAFGDVAASLVDDHGLSAEDAVVVAERVFRGSDGTFPGLGRERVYLESFVRVRARLAAHPTDEVVLASGQIAVDAIDALRPFAPPVREDRRLRT